MLSDFDPMFVNVNLTESALWIGIGVAFFVAGVCRAGQRRFLWFLTGTFIVFGVCDIIETRTGAWWRPWWLLAIKCICVLIFLVTLVKYVRMKRMADTIPECDDNDIQSSH